ncbi:PQQ-binding-like beta-propeller repeat protein [Streptomyces sp. Ag109_O5-1]|uniref:outer membrane protein assembly factor BamB family protein n=1 Tax=Streptomyces sp. Ag109_O5-1 TaxID=1938851 RepID=UPI000F4FB630|nr:PQQ-binding-like beta-propeller repeat protein [Streptomyces sp. Ag109_O5-1]
MTGVDVGDRTLWKVPGGGIPYRTPAIADGAVYVLDDLFDLVAVDADTGQRRWTLPNDSPIEASPVVGTGVVYFADSAGPLRSLPNPAVHPSLCAHLRYAIGDAMQTGLVQRVADLCDVGSAGRPLDDRGQVGFLAVGEQVAAG